MKVAFIEGRPNSHPTHALYAKSVNSDFYFVDRYLPYHFKKNPSKLRCLLSWTANALFFHNKKKYNVFLSEEPYLSLVLMKKLRLISKDQKIVSILGTHTLYFLHTKRYNFLTTWFLKFIFNSYDAIICEGSMQKDLLDIYIKSNNVKIFDTFNGNPTVRFDELYNNNPTLSEKNILTIAGMPNEERMYYKGIDLMIAAFAKSLDTISNLTYTIVGDYDIELLDQIFEKYPIVVRSKIIFVGKDYDLLKYIKQSSLYLHTARGEAWGVSVTEAMLGGLPTIVSEWTGSKDIVEKVDNSYILPLDSDLISNKIIEYFNLPLNEKITLSNKFKKESSKLTEANAVENFKKMFTLSVE
jgi:glycosyltransferase involved in cell wall biosynthesis